MADPTDRFREMARRREAWHLVNFCRIDDGGEDVAADIVERALAAAYEQGRRAALAHLAETKPRTMPANVPDGDAARIIYDFITGGTLDREACVELIRGNLDAVREEGRREARTWRPIETAPRDGARVDLLVRGFYVGKHYRELECWWNADWSSWVDQRGFVIGGTALGWMLPPSVDVPAAEPAREDGA